MAQVSAGRYAHSRPVVERLSLLDGRPVRRPRVCRAGRLTAWGAEEDRNERAPERPRLAAGGAGRLWLGRRLRTSVPVPAPQLVGEGGPHLRPRQRPERPGTGRDADQEM